MSQSIKSDKISESSIARIAGNIMAGCVGRSALPSREEEWAVNASVRLARAIAAEVERTREREAKTGGETR